MVSGDSIGALTVGRFRDETNEAISWEQLACEFLGRPEMRGMSPAEVQRLLYWASDRWPEHVRFRSIACSVLMQSGVFWQLLVCLHR